MMLKITGTTVKYLVAFMTTHSGFVHLSPCLIGNTQYFSSEKDEKIKTKIKLN
jgi:hypothetical protein